MAFKGITMKREIPIVDGTSMQNALCKAPSTNSDGQRSKTGVSVKMPNETIYVPEFVLQCAIEKDKITFTIVALAFIYVGTILGNLLVIVVIILNPHLQNPMFYYIFTLAVIDVVNSTNLIPRILAILVFNDNVVPYGPCLFQLSIVYHLGLTESFLFPVMACDRYLAVVYPLRYPSIVTNKTVGLSILFVNICAAATLVPYMVFARELSFCRSNVLPYCFCDFVTMIHISCTSDPRHLALLSSTTIITGFGGLGICLLSYIRIVLAALKISSVEGLGVQVSAEAYNVLVIIAILVPPMMNPIIYSFRNKEIKGSIYRLWTGKRVDPSHH
ncbi:putative olfactory receptor 7A2 [Polypterus senegalus]|uniref:putative olfactory receptor 7A2 n=1 Tax=Polypterus senegalus TaxID=55291 RepID=UPI0019656055|nr:putative olfactory receptor 7A2 [Polypterus senegalus]